MDHREPGYHLQHLMIGALPSKTQKAVVQKKVHFWVVLGFWHPVSLHCHCLRFSLVLRKKTPNASLLFADSTVPEPQKYVYKIAAFWATFCGFGLLFYLLLGPR